MTEGVSETIFEFWHGVCLFIVSVSLVVNNRVIVQTAGRSDSPCRLPFVPFSCAFRSLPAGPGLPVELFHIPKITFIPSEMLSLQL